MSKTIRRKSVKTPDWVIHHYKYIDGRFQWIQLEGKELKKEIALYHSDKDKYNMNEPKWFRKEIERYKRVQDKREVARILREEDYWDYNFNPRKRDGKWLWW